MSIFYDCKGCSNRNGSSRYLKLVHSTYGVFQIPFPMALCMYYWGLPIPPKKMS